MVPGIYLTAGDNLAGVLAIGAAVSGQVFCAWGFYGYEYDA